MALPVGNRSPSRFVASSKKFYASLLRFAVWNRNMLICTASHRFFRIAPALGRRRQVDTNQGHCQGLGAEAKLYGVEVMAKKSARKPPKTKVRPYDIAEHLRTPQEMAAYLDAWLEEASEDAPGIARALGNVCAGHGALLHR
jgi:hypothetical protein